MIVACRAVVRASQSWLVCPGEALRAEPLCGVARVGFSAQARRTIDGRSRWGLLTCWVAPGKPRPTSSLLVAQCAGRDGRSQAACCVLHSAQNVTLVLWRSAQHHSHHFSTSPTCENIRYSGRVVVRRGYKIIMHNIRIANKARALLDGSRCIANP